MNKTICVYCSASDAVDAMFFEVASAMGRAIAQRGDRLIYGGGAVGLMGAVARATHEHGGHVIAVLPEKMRPDGVAYEQADELVWAADMRERKAVMDMRADAFVALPGGFGTLEELFEILTHRHLRYHDKPIVIVNSHGFYDPLLKLFEHMYEHRFAKRKFAEHYCVVQDPDAAVRHIEAMG